MGKIEAFLDADDGDAAIGAFLDAPTATPKPKAKVGAGEAFYDDLRSGGLQLGKTATAVAGSPLLLLDAAAQALAGKDTGAAEWFAKNIFGAFAGPAAYLERKRAETERDIPAQVAGAGGSLVSMLPDLVAGNRAQAGLKLAGEASQVVPSLTNALTRAWAGAQPMAARAGAERRAKAKELGAGDLAATNAGLAAYANLTAQGMAPMGMPGGVAKRVATGATVNPVLDVGGRALENVVNAPSGAPQLQHDLTDLGQLITSSVLGAGMHGALGAPRAPGFQAPRDIAADRAAFDAGTGEAQARTADFARFRPILEANGITDPDSVAAQMAINALRAREARAAEAEAARALEATPISPDEMRVRESGKPPAVIPVDSQGRADAGQIGTKAGVLSAGGTKAATEKQAGQAFDLAARRQGQADADLANRDEIGPDYQGGGSAAHGGRFDQGVREVTLLGERPVTIMESGVGRNGDQTIIGYEGPDGKMHAQAVPTASLKTYRVPVNQRMAQDFVSRSSTPPDGVGTETMAGEKMPRRSTDRIAGDEIGGQTTAYNPRQADRGPDAIGGEVLPPEPQPGGPLAPRRGATVAGEASRAAEAVPARLAAPDQPPPKPQAEQPARQPEPEATKPPPEQPAPETTKRGLDERLADPEVRRHLREMADETKWFEEGGKILMQADGKTFIDKTRWIPQAEWWAGKPAEMTDKSVSEAVRRLESGERLRPVDRRVLDLMSSIADDNIARFRKVEEAVRAGEEEARIERDSRPLTEAEERAFANDGARRDAGITDDDINYLLKVASDEYRQLRAEETAESFHTEGQAAEGMAGEPAGASSAKNARPDDQGIPGRVDEARSQDHAAQRPDVLPERGREAGPDVGTGDDAGLLRSHDAGELRAREQQRAAAERVESGRQTDLENRAKADAERGDFQLTGSDRPADANPRQGDLVGDTPQKAIENDSRLANPDSPAGAKLYSGLPVDEMGKIAKALFGWNKGEFQEWQDRLAAIFGSHKADKERSPFGANKPLKARSANAVGQVWRTLIHANTGTLEALQRQFKSSAIDDIISMFSERAGSGQRGEATWRSLTEGRVHRIYSEMEHIFGATGPSGKRLVADEQAVNRTADLVKNRGQIKKDGDAIHQAAAKVAQLLDDEMAHLKRSGVEVQKLANYFPDRLFNVAAIMGDAKAFRAAAERAFRIDGAGALDAAALADDLMRGVIAGEHGLTGNPFLPHARAATDAKFTKHRTFSERAVRDSGLSDFYYQNKLEALKTYFQKTSRKAAYEHFFGGKTEDGLNNAKWREIEARLEQEGNLAAIGPLKDTIAAIVGEIGTLGPGGRTAISHLRTLNVLAYLSGIGTVMSSIAEPLTAASRSGNPADLLRAPAMTFRNLGHQLAKRFDNKAFQSASAEEAYRITELVGAASTGILHDSLAAARLGVGPTPTSLGSMMARTALTWSGLEPLTAAQRAMAAGVMGRHMQNVAADFLQGKKLAARELRDLGVPAAEHQAFAEWMLAQNKGETGGVSVKALEGVREGANRMVDLYKEAMYTAINQSIMTPTKASKARYASHPSYGIAYDLLSFSYEYTQQVVKRAYRMAKESATHAKDYTPGEHLQMWMPAITAGMLMPLMQYVLLPVRDFVMGNDPDKQEERRKKSDVETPLGTIEGGMIEAVSRSGVLGQYDPLLNLIRGVRYNRDLANAALGPSLGGLANLAQQTIAYFDANKNSENTNTAERALAKSAWDMLAEPSLVALNTLNWRPAGILAQHAIKNEESKAAFVDWAAGPEKTKEDYEASKALREWRKQYKPD